ncbi:MAG: hypothetical protein AAGD32_06685 [Planctomycetota bacterium]
MQTHSIPTGAHNVAADAFITADNAENAQSLLASVEPTDDDLAEYASHLARHEPVLDDDAADALAAIRYANEQRGRIESGVRALLGRLNRPDLAALLTVSVTVGIASHVDGQRVGDATYRIESGSYSGEWSTDRRTSVEDAVVMAVDSFLLDADLPDVPALGFRL